MEETPHTCLQAEVLGTIKADVGHIKEGQATHDKQFLRLFNVLEGKEGVVTQAQLNKASIKKLWRFVWIFVAGFAGVFFFVIRKSL